MVMRATILFLLCQVGGPALEAKEQAVIREFYGYFEKKLGYPAGTIKGEYLVERSQCLAALQKDPQVVMLSLDVFLSKRKELKLEPLAQIELDVGTTDHWYLMSSRVSGPSTPAEVKGKPITGAGLDDKSFVARVVLDGALGGPDELVLVPEALGLRAIRSVIGGKAQAVLLDGVSYRGLTGTPFERKLKTVYESKPLPTPPIAVTPAVDKETATQLAGALLSMRGDPKGQSMLAAFGLKGFVKPDPAVYDAAEARLKGP